MCAISLIFLDLVGICLLRIFIKNLLILRIRKIFVKLCFINTENFNWTLLKRVTYFVCQWVNIQMSDCRNIASSSYLLLDLGTTTTGYHLFNIVFYLAFLSLLCGMLLWRILLSFEINHMFLKVTYEEISFEIVIVFYLF